MVAAQAAAVRCLEAAVLKRSAAVVKLEAAVLKRLAAVVKHLHPHELQLQHSHRYVRMVAARAAARIAPWTPVKGALNPKP